MSLNKLEQIIGYEFQNKDLLQRAVTTVPTPTNGWAVPARATSAWNSWEMRCWAPASVFSCIADIRTRKRDF